MPPKKPAAAKKKAESESEKSSANEKSPPPPSVPKKAKEAPKAKDEKAKPETGIATKKKEALDENSSSMPSGSDGKDSDYGPDEKKVNSKARGGKTNDKPAPKKDDAKASAAAKGKDGDSDEVMPAVVNEGKRNHPRGAKKAPSPAGNENEEGAEMEQDGKLQAGGKNTQMAKLDDALVEKNKIKAVTGIDTVVKSSEEIIYTVNWTNRKGEGLVSSKTLRHHNYGDMLLNFWEDRALKTQQ